MWLYSDKTLLAKPGSSLAALTWELLFGTSSPHIHGGLGFSQVSLVSRCDCFLYSSFKMNAVGTGATDHNRTSIVKYR